jgi:hypothetical protein
MVTDGPTEAKTLKLEQRRVRLEERRLEAEIAIREAERGGKRAEEQAHLRQATFDRRYRLLELRERREDRALKRQELQINQGRGIKFTSAQATVAAAALALFSAAIGGWIQSAATRDVEAAKNQALLAVEELKAKSSIELEKQKQSAAEHLDRAKFETTLILRATEAARREDQVRNLKFFLDAGFIADPNGKIQAIHEDAYPSLPPPVAEVNFPKVSAASPETTFVLTISNLGASAPCLAAAGTKYVARYYRDPKSGFPSLSRQEAQELSKSGISIIVIFESSSDRAEHFSRSSGVDEADKTLIYARDQIKQPRGTVIFFAVDFDASAGLIESQIIPYFKAINEVNRSDTNNTGYYRIGVYGSGNVINKLRAAGLVQFGWLASSLGWGGSAQMRSEGTWDILETGSPAASPVCGAIWNSANTLNPRLGSEIVAFSLPPQ